MRPKNFKKCMKLNWNFQRGGEMLGKIFSVGEVRIFSGTTQFESVIIGLQCVQRALLSSYLHALQAYDDRFLF